MLAYAAQDHARYFLACALMGVQHLHQLRVVLRSLKPEERRENASELKSLEDCALDSVGRLKLIDFGLSKLLGIILRALWFAEVHHGKDLHHLRDT